MLPLPDCDQLPERCREPMPRRYELLRPWVRFHERPATQRAEATHTPPATVGTLQRRFAPQGMRGLVPDSVEVVPSGARPRVSDAVLQALQRLKGLDDGFPSRERARIISDTLADRLGDHTVTRLWQQRPGTSPPQLPLRDSHRYPARAHARFAVIQLSVQGGSTTSLSRFLPVSRPPINAGMDRCERDHFARLEDQSAAPKTPACKAWLPVMLEMDHWPKRHPEAGGFRMWSLRGQPDRSVRPVARIMAGNRQVYDALPHVGRKRTKTAPQRQPFKASGAHASWFMDGRMMDFAFDGVQGGSLIGLDGSARPRLAGAVAPPEASWGALTVLSSACRRYGAPAPRIAESGGASLSADFEAVGTRWEIDHQTMSSTQGESALPLMETHGNIPRRLSDSQFALTRTPLAVERAPQAFLPLDHTTAPPGRRTEPCTPPMPLAVLGEARGRFETPDERARRCSRALFPRTTHRYGGVTLPRYPF